MPIFTNATPVVDSMKISVMYFGDSYRLFSLTYPLSQKSLVASLPLKGWRSLMISLRQVTDSFSCVRASERYLRANLAALMSRQ